jgi:hypothetical protein
MRPRKHRRKNGSGLVEAAAALVLLLPLFLVLLAVTAEVVQVYLIKDALTAASHQAARQLTLSYWQNSQIATSRSLQESTVFDKIRINNMIVNSAQFSTANFDLNADPPVVTVGVVYTCGKWGLPAFRPDVLKLGSFTISSGETHALE